MAANLKQYLYSKGTDAGLDAEFAGASAYGRVKPGQTVIFWKVGLRWYVISLEKVQRIFRRVETVYGKMCCGRQSFVIERLVLILHDHTEVEIYIGDDMERQAKALLEVLKNVRPEIQYGKNSAHPA